MTTKAGNRLVDYPAYRLHYKIDNPRRRRGPDVVALRFLTDLGKRAVTLGREFVGWAEAKRRVTKEGLTLRWDCKERNLAEHDRPVLEEWQASFGVLADRLRDEGIEVTVLADTSYTTESGVYVPKSQVQKAGRRTVVWIQTGGHLSPHIEDVTDAVPFVRLTLK